MYQSNESDGELFVKTRKRKEGKVYKTDTSVMKYRIVRILFSLQSDVKKMLHFAHRHFCRIRSCFVETYSRIFSESILKLLIDIVKQFLFKKLVSELLILFNVTFWNCFILQDKIEKAIVKWLFYFIMQLVYFNL